jgi:chemotaxis protein CheC
MPFRASNPFSKNSGLTSMLLFFSSFLMIKWYILSSSTISKLAEDIDTNVSFSAPTIKKLTSVDQLKNLFISKYKKVITISTELKFEDLDIHGELFIFTTDNSIVYIKEKLNKILDEL